MIKLEVINDWIDDKEYLDFVINKSDNGTIYHHIKFLSYHNESFYTNKSKIHLKFYKKGRIIASCLAVLYRDSNGKFVLNSPFGGSYGGILVDNEISYLEYKNVYNLFLEFCHEKSITIIQLINTTSIHSKNSKCEYDEFILLSEDFSVLKSDILLVYNCIENNEDLISTFERKTRTELRQALNNKDISIEIIRGITSEVYDVLLLSQTRLNSKPTHSLEDLVKIDQLFPGSIHTFVVKNQNKIAAGITVVKVNEKVLNTFYIFDDFESRDLKVNHFAYYHVLKWAKLNQFKYLDFGPTTFGFTPNFPLLKFKEKFGTFPVNRKTFIKTFDKNKV